MTRIELLKIISQFNTFASQMLKADSNEDKVFIQTFYDFISETPIIYDYIQECYSEDYNFEATFSGSGLQNKIILPSNQKELISYEYQLIRYILSGNTPLFHFGFAYLSGRRIDVAISNFMKKVIEPFVVALKGYLNLCLIDVEEKEYSDSNLKKTIFLSYCQKDSKYADLLDSKLSKILERKVRISRDIRDVNCFDSFSEFMLSIQKHDFVIMLISDHYLKSRNCRHSTCNVSN